MRFRILGKDLTSAEKFQLFLIFLLQASLAGAALWALFGEQWITLFVSLFALGSTLIPFIFLKQHYGLVFPVEFEFAIVAFIYASLFLGEVGGYYDRFWWWDMVLHGASGFALGFAGFLILYVLYVSGKIMVGPFLFALFTFSFALSLGALWEIFEFTMDTFLDMNMQRRETGVIDTMLDLVVDAIGAFIAAVLGFEFIRQKQKGVSGRNPFHFLVSKFFKRNPWIERR